ncbi:MAG: amidohydrolase family protein [Deltaproteobacteria bacterium]|nr:amidohydrolase family protein [Deltaproteobacteria bacterium]MBN2687973.1 amidohydrolase family protein [Deltaproteobacteria bacterium]
MKNCSLSLPKASLYVAVLILLLITPWPTADAEQKKDSYDIVIEGGKIYDGTLKPPYRADIGIVGDKIVAVGKLKGKSSKILKADGCIVTPGFIDIHEHSDMVFSGDLDGLLPEDKKELEGNFNALYQGVTTVVTGNCGNSISDTAKWFAIVESIHFGTNVMHLVPHGRIRYELFGDNQPKALTLEQLDTFKARVEQEMKKGACGMSTGLAYAPGINATTEELIELSKVVNRYGGIYATHMRDERGAVLEGGKIAVLEAIREAIEIGRQSGAPVQISHLKLQAPHNGVKASQMLNLIEAARKEGLDVTTDSYPYTAGASELCILLPSRFKKATGGIAEEYKTEAGKREIGSAIEKVFVDIPPDKIIFLEYEGKPEYKGKTLKDISAAEGKNSLDCYVDIVCGDSMPTVIAFAHNEKAMRDFMPNHYVFTCSDGMTWSRDIKGAHPRFYGAFARKLKKYCLDDGLMSLTAAIRSMTYLPAEKMGMTGRGKIAEGAFADIAVIDLKSLKDRATYENPTQYAEGIVHLLVNGVVTIEDRKLTGRRAGRPLKGRAAR